MHGNLFQPLPPLPATIRVPVSGCNAQTPWQVTAAQNVAAQPGNLRRLISVRHVPVPGFRSPEFSRTPPVAASLLRDRCGAGPMQLVAVPHAAKDLRMADRNEHRTPYEPSVHAERFLSRLTDSVFTSESVGVHPRRGSIVARGSGPPFASNAADQPRGSPRIHRTPH